MENGTLFGAVRFALSQFFVKNSRYFFWYGVWPLANFHRDVKNCTVDVKNSESILYTNNACFFYLNWLIIIPISVTFSLSKSISNAVPSFIHF